MHAILGMSLANYTFTLTLKIGNKLATTLVDSGSTSTFMTPEFAAAAQCSLQSCPKLKVLVANSEQLLT
jgi:predicted aspartyl protease